MDPHNQTSFIFFFLFLIFFIRAFPVPLLSSSSISEKVRNKGKFSQPNALLFILFYLFIFWSTRDLFRGEGNVSDTGGPQHNLSWHSQPIPRKRKQRLSIREVMQWAEVTRPSYPLHAQELIGSRPGSARILKMLPLEALG